MHEKAERIAKEVEASYRLGNTAHKLFVDEIEEVLEKNGSVDGVIEAICRVYPLNNPIDLKVLKVIYIELGISESW